MYEWAAEGESRIVIRNGTDAVGLDDEQVQSLYEELRDFLPVAEAEEAEVPEDEYEGYGE